MRKSQQRCIDTFGPNYRLASVNEVKYATENCDYNKDAYGKLSNGNFAVPYWYWKD